MYLAEIEEIKYSMDTEVLSLAWYSVFLCCPGYAVKEMTNPQIYLTCYENNGLRGFYSQDEFHIKKIKLQGVSMICVGLPKSRTKMGRYASRLYLSYKKTLKGYECPQFYYVEGNRLGLIGIDGNTIECGLFEYHNGGEKKIIRNYYKYYPIFRQEIREIKKTISEYMNNTAQTTPPVR